MEGAVVGDAAMNEGEVRASVERILADLFQRYRYKGQIPYSNYNNDMSTVMRQKGALRTRPKVKRALSPAYW